jgi:hypothetical protein
MTDKQHVVELLDASLEYFRKGSEGVPLASQWISSETTRASETSVPAEIGPSSKRPPSDFDRLNR